MFDSTSIKPELRYGCPACQRTTELSQFRTLILSHLLGLNRLIVHFIP